MEPGKIWAFKYVTDENRSYRSIDTYSDKLEAKYVYDNFVPNNKQVSQGDIAIILDKSNILGFARIDSIAEEASTKKRGRCPTCSVTNFEARKNKNPLYRCNNGHEFSNFNEEVVPSKSYTASYGTSFIKLNSKVPISKLRPYYANNYNRNMSIQLVDVRFFDGDYEHVIKTLRNATGYILPAEAANTAQEPNSNENYSPGDDDERESITRQIKARRGQQQFRDALRARYGNICMITKCELLDVLEAAHIKPYRGSNDNHPGNGLLLRSDIHTLFDLNLIGIKPETMEIFIHPSAMIQEYQQYHGSKLTGCGKERPSIEALQIRWELFNRNMA
jgi:putative restriction endonuclease